MNNENYNSISDKELLKVLVKEDGRSSLQALCDANTLPEIILSATESDLIAVEGIGHVTASRIMAVQQIIKRLLSDRYQTHKTKLSSPYAVYQFMQPLKYLQHEELHIIYLDRKQHVKDVQMISKGNLSSTIFDLPMIFKHGLRCGGVAGLIAVHNHPSGDCHPSPDDVAVTKRLSEAGKLLGIKLYDHVIVADTYYSLSENGYI